MLQSLRNRFDSSKRDIGAVIFLAFVLPPLMFEDREEAKEIIRHFVTWWLPKSPKKDAEPENEDVLLVCKSPKCRYVFAVHKGGERDGKWEGPFIPDSNGKIVLSFGRYTDSCVNNYTAEEVAEIWGDCKWERV